MKNPFVLAFFLFVLIGGCLILPDFGMSWDEHPQREHGLVSADYVNEYFGWDRPLERDWLPLKKYKSKHYGVLFQLTSYYAADFLEIKTERKEYLFKHYCGFIFFWLASIVFYKMLRYRFEDWRVALLGTAFLIFSPRIFGHAFFNPKDTILLSGIIFSTYTLLKFIELKTLKYALLHALTCAVVINIRIVGIIVPAFTFLFLAFAISQKIIANKTNFTWWQLVWTTILWSILTSLLTVFFWPYLWENPLENLQEAFIVMSQYPWDGKINLYGDWLQSTDLPWYYVPAWLGATTPLLYVLGGMAGLFLVLRQTILNFFKEKCLYKNRAEMIDLFAFGFFIGAIFIVVFKGSVLYNGWRQMYFIYPAFLLLAMVAFAEVFQFISKQKDNFRKQLLAQICTILITLQIGAVAFFMYQYHPWYHLYFGLLSGKNRTERFEMDYWGTAHRQAFQQIAKLDHRAKIKVATMQYDFPGILNYKLLSDELKERIELTTNFDEADYIIVDFIGKNLLDNRHRSIFPFNQEPFFEFSVEGDVFLRVVRK